MFVLVLAAADLIGLVRLATFSASLDASLAPEPSGRTTDAVWSFPFEGRRSIVTVLVDDAEIAGAARLDTADVFSTRGWLRDAYVARLVAAAARSPLVDRLVAEFRRIRDERELDGDRYLELMTTAVQAIPYGEVTDEIQLPAEVLAGGQGVCTEKSVLLAAVLVHEGYDTVLWVFPTQHHVALGVRSDAVRFRDTQYAYVETTVDAFVGQAEAGFASYGPVVRPPRQISLGGSRAYSSGEQVEYILDELARAETISASTHRYVSVKYAAPGRLRERFAERAQEHWAANATTAFILGNTHDRVGVYSLLTGGGVVSAGSPQLLF